MAVWISGKYKGFVWGMVVLSPPAAFSIQIFVFFFLRIQTSIKSRSSQTKEGLAEAQGNN